MRSDLSNLDLEISPVSNDRENGRAWDNLVAQFKPTHVLQSAAWGEVKADFGWKPLRARWYDADGVTVAAVQILERVVRLPGMPVQLRVLYAPKGPLLDWRDVRLRSRVLADLGRIARRRNAIFIKIDPDVVVGKGIPGQPDACEDPLGADVVAELSAHGWRFSPDQIQFRNTVVINLSPEEEELLANMKQKTRYNVRLAGRKGVEVRVGGPGDLDLLYRMYAQTSVRDGFVIREAQYYRRVWGTFLSSGQAEALIAEVEGAAVGAVIIFRFGDRAWYLYGMSTENHREKMPNYLLQWEAMRRAREAGCLSYDLWGAPDVFAESDDLWGVYRFKEGLGGTVERRLGAWDWTAQSTRYWMYTRLLPRILDILRRRGNAATRASLGA